MRKALQAQLINLNTALLAGWDQLMKNPEFGKSTDDDLCRLADKIRGLRDTLATIFAERRAPNGRPRPEEIEYDPALDPNRNATQMGRIFELMSRGGWWTGSLLKEELGGHTDSLTADMRNLRKNKHGAWIVLRQVVDGISEYCLHNPDGSPMPPNVEGYVNAIGS